MQWPKGQSGNPSTQFKPGHKGIGGRPRKRPFTKRIELLAEMVLPDELRKGAFKEFPAEATLADAAVFALFMRAMTGDVAAIRECRESVEGRSGQRLESLREDVVDQALDEFEMHIAALDPANRSLILAAEMKILEIAREENPIEPTPSGLASEPSGEIGAQEAGPEGPIGPDVSGSEGGGPKT